MDLRTNTILPSTQGRVSTDSSTQLRTKILAYDIVSYLNCVCVRACVRAFMRACVRVRARARVRVRVCSSTSNSTRKYPDVI